jgi:hypothetical protein
MVLTKSGYQTIGESFSVLQLHRQSTRKAGTSSSMSVEEEVTPNQSDLSDKVDMLTMQLETVLKWIQAQPSSSSSLGLMTVGDGISPPRARLTTERDKTHNDANSLLVTGARPQPFKVEARIDIPTFDGTIDAEKLDSWVDQLETYFTLYGFSSGEKVAFARLKLTSHVLAWWNAFLKTNDDREISWKEFTQLLRQEFYPMGYSQDRWLRWHNLRQRQNQTVQKYTTEFHRLAVTLGIGLDNEDVFTKFVAGLYQQIQNELRLYQATSVSNASSIAMAIEQKNKPSRQRTIDNGKEKNGGNQNSKKYTQKGISSSFSKSTKFCEHCKISGREKRECWKLHPELFSTKWKKDDKGKCTMTTTIFDDHIELGQVKKADMSLSLMAMSKETTSNLLTVSNEKEELFTLRIQVKHEIIEAIVDIGSQKNLISASLVQKLGLETIPHLRPYPLGWIQKDVELKIDRQCKFHFAITNQYIDEVTCEVVPLDICQVIFGSPYLWERDVIYHRRAQQYQLEKDGKKYIVNKDRACQKVDLVTAYQARRMINASQKFVLMMIRPVENEVKASSITLSCRALDSKLNELLGKYTNLFIEVGGLPPKRAVEHEIQLISDSTLPNLRMYRNLVMENEEIKRQVTELLDTGVIKPSSSHCGSPIVLVPKKDGGWCMCIDYRALNKITIKN